jgi:hypothetical protein
LRSRSEDESARKSAAIGRVASDAISTLESKPRLCGKRLDSFDLYMAFVPDREPIRTAGGEAFEEQRTAGARRTRMIRGRVIEGRPEQGGLSSCPLALRPPL